MNVCGVLVHAHPARIGAVEACLAAMAGVETHGRAAGARLVVTVEDTPGRSAADALAELNAVPGVIAAALVYHQFEPDDAGPAAEGRAILETQPC